MRITKRAVEKVKKMVQRECAKVPKKDRGACERAAIGVGRALARELSKCNRLRGAARRACHKGRIVTMRGIAGAK
jgi:hypothetical protein